MTRNDVLALAARVEAATGAEQHEMLEAAFVAAHGPKPERVHGGSAGMDAWLILHNPFVSLLWDGGFLDAAMSLVPSGMLWSVEWVGHQTRDRIASCTIWKPHMPTSIAVAATPALALTSAALRAIAERMPE